MTEQTKSELYLRVDEAIQTIRPNLQADGGDIQLVDVVDGVVKVKLQGACHGCPMAAMTLQMGVERVLKNQIPEVTGVESVTDDEE
jgi:Fe-S cluster biogenesis protein NfuA